MDIKKPQSNKSATTKPAVGYAQPAVSPQKTNKFSKKHALIIIGVVVGVVLVALLSFVLYKSYSNKTSQGEVSSQEIDRYAKGVVEYKAQYPDEVIVGDPKQVAIDDLVLNKALKAEAKASNKELTTEEINTVLHIPSDVINTQAYIEGVVSTNDAGFVAITRKLNQEYRRKLQDTIIAKRKLLFSTVSFDTPYNYSQKTEADIARVHQEGLDLLKSKMLPLYESKASIEQIAKASDVNNLDGSAGTPQALQLYYTQLVTNAQLIDNYSLDQTQVDNAIPDDLVKQLQEVSASTSDPAKKVITAPTAFSQIRSTNKKDLDDVDYGAPIKDLRNTNELIARLTNPGDYTQPFASKSGAHMIVRLEAKSGGNYNTWEEYLKKSRDKYYKNNQIVASDISKIILSKLGFADYKKVAMSMVHSTAGVAHATQTCSGHDYALNVDAYKIDNVGALTQIYSVSSHIAQSGPCPNTFDYNGSLPFNRMGNCMNYAPTYSNPPSNSNSNHRYIGAIVQPWDPENVNQDSQWGVRYFYQRTDDTNRSVVATSTLRRDGPGGTPFSTNATLNGTHRLYASGYNDTGAAPFLQKTYTLSSNVNSLVVNAQSPPAVTDGQGRRWTRVVGVPEVKSATVSSSYDFEFRYELLPTCQMSASPSTLPNNNSYNTTITWSSTNADTATSADLSGTLAVSGSQAVTLPVNNSGSATTKTYNMTVTSVSGDTYNCSTTVTINPTTTNNPPVPSVDIKANGDNGPITLNPGDPLTLSWTSTNIRTTPEPICTALATPNTASWAGNKAASSSGEIHTSDLTTSTTSITYSITCNGVSGSSPTTATDSVTVSVNQVAYYPWLQTLNGDVGSYGKIVGQNSGPASNLSVNPGGRRYNDATDRGLGLAEATYVVAGSVAGGSNFCSAAPNYYTLGQIISSIKNNCTTGGYGREGVSVENPIAATESAYNNNGAGNTTAPTNACKPYRTKSVASGGTIDLAVNLSCAGVVAPTVSVNPNAGGGIQKAETNTFNLSIPAGQTITGKGTFFVKVPSSAPAGQKARLNINSNILYPATAAGATTPAQLPNFSIVVDGDVFIDNAVTEIDAAIIASGKIYTCSQAISTVTPLVFNYNPACSNKLTIYGQLVGGGGIDFGRRAYNAQDPNNNPAEKIILTYQSVMFPPPGLSKSDGNTSSQLETDYQEYAPILQ